MLTTWATIGVQVVYLPLVVLLVIRGLRRGKLFVHQVLPELNLPGERAVFRQASRR